VRADGEPYQNKTGRIWLLTFIGCVINLFAALPLFVLARRMSRTSEM
jgi:hypothetical protein